MEKTAAPGLETTCDAFLGGKITILQSKSGPRAGIDSVLLASSIPAKEGQCLLEAGAGSGVVSLCAAGRVRNLQLTGVELQPELADIARKNAIRNGIQDRCRIIEGDVTGSGNSWKNMGVIPDSFDHSFANPPFYDQAQSRRPLDPSKAQAHIHDVRALERWVRFLVTHTRPRGTVTIIHTAEMLGKLLGLYERRVGNIRVYPIYSKKGQPASRILIQGVKASKGPLHIDQGLIMHDEDGAFTQRAAAILRDGAGLFE